LIKIRDSAQKKTDNVYPTIYDEKIIPDEKMGIAPKKRNRTAESLPNIRFTILDNNATEANQIIS
tara:strand:+ start:228 stop:422 length:195 start_codon:yes stop_codon:yes gene_type:complete